MKRKEWRKMRAGEALEEHTLGKQPLDTALKNISLSLVRILRWIARSTEPLAGTSLAGCYELRTAKQFEALVKRGLLDVKWSKVPHRAPLAMKVDSVTASERGRALLAAYDLGNLEEKYLYGFDVGHGIQAVSLSVYGLGGGGGGGSGAGNGVAAASAGSGVGIGGAGGNVPLVPGQQYQVNVGSSKEARLDALDPSVGTVIGTLKVPPEAFAGKAGGNGALEVSFISDPKEEVEPGKKGP